MTRDEAAQAITDAVDAIHTAYWAACDAAETVGHRPASSPW